MDVNGSNDVADLCNLPFQVNNVVVTGSEGVTHQGCSESENTISVSDQTVQNISQQAFPETTDGSVVENESSSYYLEEEEVDKNFCNESLQTEHALEIKILKPEISKLSDKSKSEIHSDASLHATSDFEAGQYSYCIGTLEKLDRTKLCSFMNCDDETCQEVCSILKQLEDPAVSVDNLTIEQKDLLTCVCEHCDCCDELRCPFYWCWSLPQGIDTNIPDFGRLRIAKKSLEGFANDPIPWQFSRIKFMKLDDSVTFDMMPVMYQDWVPLCRIPGTSSIVATPTKDEDVSEQRLWVLTMVPSGEKETLDWQLRLFSKLYQLTHDNITRLFWLEVVQACEDSDNYRILMCSQFEGPSLYDRIQSQTVNVRQATSIILQLLPAVEYLHSLGIVYLNWSSSNVLLSEQDKGIVKLRDFSASVLLEKNVDAEYHPLVLPKHLSPPELISSNYVCEKSDVWGLACLLVELLTNQTVWYDLRHDDEHLLQKIEDSQLPKIPDSLPESMSSIVVDCFKIDPEERPQVSDLRIRLLQCFDRSILYNQ